MLTTGQIEKIYKEVQPHFVSGGNIAGYARLFTDDAVWWPLGRDTYVGPQEIVDGVAGVLKGNNTTPSFEAMEIHIDGDGKSGWAAIHGTIKVVYDNGQPTDHIKSREVWIFKEVNGEAKISRMIWNQEPN